MVLEEEEDGNDDDNDLALLGVITEKASVKSTLLAARVVAPMMSDSDSLLNIVRSVFLRCINS